MKTSMARTGALQKQHLSLERDVARPGGGQNNAGENGERCVSGGGVTSGTAITRSLSCEKAHHERQSKAAWLRCF